MKKHIFGTVLSQVFQIVLGLGTSIISTRLLGPVGKGEYAIFITAISFGALFFDFGIQSALGFLVARKDLVQNKAHGILVLIMPVLVLLFALSVVAASRWSKLEIFLPEKHDTPLYMLLICLAFATTLVSQWVKGLMSANLQFKQINLLNYVRAISLFLVFVGFYLLSEKALIVTDAYWLYLLSLVATMLFGLWSYLKLNGPWRVERPTKKEFNQIFGWGGLMYASNVAQFLNYRLDFWLVNFYLGSASLGLYSLSSNLGQMFWLLPAAISTVLLPSIAKGGTGQTKANLDRTLFMGRFLMFLGIISFVGALLFGKQFMVFAYGEAFEESAAVLIWLLLGIIPFALTKIYASFLSGVGRQRENLIASYSGLVLTILLDLWLIPKMGIIGAAIGTAVSYLFTSAYVFWIIIRDYDQRFIDTFLIKRADFLLLRNILRKFSEATPTP